MRDACHEHSTLQGCQRAMIGFLIHILHTAGLSTFVWHYALSPHISSLKVGTHMSIVLQNDHHIPTCNYIWRRQLRWPRCSTSKSLEIPVYRKYIHTYIYMFTHTTQICVCICTASNMVDVGSRDADMCSRQKPLF
jgi:hypothetical protein